MPLLRSLAGLEERRGYKHGALDGACATLSHSGSPEVRGQMSVVFGGRWSESLLLAPYACASRPTTTSLRRAPSSVRSAMFIARTPGPPLSRNNAVGLAPP